MISWAATLSSTKPGPRGKAEAVVEAGEVVAASAVVEAVVEAAVAVAAAAAGTATAVIAAEAAVETAAGSCHRTIKYRTETGERKKTPRFCFSGLVNFDDHAVADLNVSTFSTRPPK